MKCTKCGNEIPNGKTVCERCGASINVVPVMTEMGRGTQPTNNQQPRTVQTNYIQQPVSSDYMQNYYYNINVLLTRIEEEQRKNQKLLKSISSSTAILAAVVIIQILLSLFVVPTIFR